MAAVSGIIEAAKRFDALAENLPDLQEGQKLVLGQVLSPLATEAYQQEQTRFIDTFEGTNFIFLQKLHDDDSATTSHVALENLRAWVMRNLTRQPRAGVGTRAYVEEALNALPPDVAVVDRVGRYTIPENDPRVQMRGQEGCKALPIEGGTGKVAIRKGEVIGPYRGYMLFTQEYQEVKFRKPPNFHEVIFQWKFLCDSYGVDISFYSQTHLSSCNSDAPTTANGTPGLKVPGTTTNRLDPSKRRHIVRKSSKANNKKRSKALGETACEEGRVEYHDGDQKYELISSAYTVGNLTCLVNDPTIDPLGAESSKSGRVQNPNVTVAEARVGAWIFPIMIAIEDIKEGQELSYCYGQGYWEMAADSLKDVYHGNLLREGAEQAKFECQQYRRENQDLKRQLEQCFNLRPELKELVHSQPERTPRRALKSPMTSHQAKQHFSGPRATLDVAVLQQPPSLIPPECFGNSQDQQAASLKRTAEDLLPAQPKCPYRAKTQRLSNPTGKTERKMWQKGQEEPSSKPSGSKRSEKAYIGVRKEREGCYDAIGEVGGGKQKKLLFLGRFKHPRHAAIKRDLQARQEKGSKLNFPNATEEALKRAFQKYAQEDYWKREAAWKAERDSVERRDPETVLGLGGGAAAGEKKMPYSKLVVKYSRKSTTTPSTQHAHAGKQIIGDVRYEVEGREQGHTIGSEESDRELLDPSLRQPSILTSQASIVYRGRRIVGVIEHVKDAGEKAYMIEVCVSKQDPLRPTIQYKDPVVAGLAHDIRAYKTCGYNGEFNFRECCLDACAKSMTASQYVSLKSGRDSLKREFRAQKVVRPLSPLSERPAAKRQKLSRSPSGMLEHAIRRGSEEDKDSLPASWGSHSRRDNSSAGAQDPAVMNGWIQSLLPESATVLEATIAAAVEGRTGDPENILPAEIDSNVATLAPPREAQLGVSAAATVIAKQNEQGVTVPVEIVQQLSTATAPPAASAGIPSPQTQEATENAAVNGSRETVGMVGQPQASRQVEASQGKAVTEPGAWSTNECRVQQGPGTAAADKSVNEKSTRVSVSAAAAGIAGRAGSQSQSLGPPAEPMGTNQPSQNATTVPVETVHSRAQPSENNSTVTAKTAPVSQPKQQLQGLTSVQAVPVSSQARHLAARQAVNANIIILSDSDDEVPVPQPVHASASVAPAAAREERQAETQPAASPFGLGVKQNYTGQPGNPALISQAASRHKHCDPPIDVGMKDTKMDASQGQGALSSGPPQLISVNSNLSKRGTLGAVGSQRRASPVLPPLQADQKGIGQGAGVVQESSGRGLSVKEHLKVVSSPAPSKEMLRGVQPDCEVPAQRSQVPAVLPATVPPPQPSSISGSGSKVAEYTNAHPGRGYSRAKNHYPGRKCLGGPTSVPLTATPANSGSDELSQSSKRHKGPDASAGDRRPSEAGADPNRAPVAGLADSCQPGQGSHYSPASKPDDCRPSQGSPLKSSALPEDKRGCLVSDAQPADKKEGRCSCQANFSSADRREDAQWEKASSSKLGRKDDCRHIEDSSRKADDRKDDRGSPYASPKKLNSSDERRLSNTSPTKSAPRREDSQVPHFSPSKTATSGARRASDSRPGKAVSDRRPQHASPSRPAPRLEDSRGPHSSPAQAPGKPEGRWSPHASPQKNVGRTAVDQAQISSSTASNPSSATNQASGKSPAKHQAGSNKSQAVGKLGTAWLRELVTLVGRPAADTSTSAPGSVTRIGPPVNRDPRALFYTSPKEGVSGYPEASKEPRSATPVMKAPPAEACKEQPVSEAAKSGSDMDVEEADYIALDTVPPSPPPNPPDFSDVMGMALGYNHEMLSEYPPSRPHPREAGAVLPPSAAPQVSVAPYLPSFLSRPADVGRPGGPSSLPPALAPASGLRQTHFLLQGPVLPQKLQQQSPHITPPWLQPGSAAAKPMEQPQQYSMP